MHKLLDENKSSSLSHIFFQRPNMSAVGSFRIIMGSIRKITDANRANYISIIMG